MIFQLQTGVLVAILFSMLAALLTRVDPANPNTTLLLGGIVVGIWVGIAGQLVAQGLLNRKDDK